MHGSTIQFLEIICDACFLGYIQIQRSNSFSEKDEQKWETNKLFYIKPDYANCSEWNFHRLLFFLPTESSDPFSRGRVFFLMTQPSEIRSSSRSSTMRIPKNPLTIQLVIFTHSSRRRRQL